MTWWDAYRLIPLIRMFSPLELRPLLTLIERGMAEQAAEVASQMAISRARGIAAGAAAKASSDATRRR